MCSWDTLYSVTPAARVLSRCVASNVLAQEDLDMVPREAQIFSTRLLEVEQLNKIKNEIAEANLDLQLLKLEKGSADVTHNHYLSQRLETLQQFTTHLQEVLREQTSLRQRLMKPLCQQSLPIQADLHRYVVELVGMVVDFIQNLEMKIKMVRCIPATEEYLSHMDTAMAQLLHKVTEVEKLSQQVLQWRDQHSSPDVTCSGD